MPRKEYLNRCQMIYYRDSEEKENWLEAAAQDHAKISPYILEMARLGRASRDPDKSESPRELAGLRIELRKARERIENLEIMREKNEAEILKLRQKAFLDPYQGQAIQREYSRKLVDLLREGGSWPGHEILATLHIPAEDSKAVDIILAQLHSLEDYGLVKETSKGWRWIHKNKK